MQKVHLGNNNNNNADCNSNNNSSNNCIIIVFYSFLNTNFLPCLCDGKKKKIPGKICKMQNLVSKKTKNKEEKKGEKKQKTIG